MGTSRNLASDWVERSNPSGGGSFAFMLRRLASEMSRKRCSAAGGEKGEEGGENINSIAKSAVVADARGARSPYLE